ncbi:MAG: FHA domain-containing protein [Rubrivivax sp.]
MSKLVVWLDGVVIKEVLLTKDRTTLGRRPYNDIVIDNLAVSGEHAALQMSGPDVSIEDLNSTNGTYINGKAIKRQVLMHNDTIEIGKYKIKYLSDEPVAAATFDKTIVLRPGAEIAPAAAPRAGAAAAASARIQVLTGAAAGRELPLTKPVTTIGRPGHQVASISRRSEGYVLAHVEGRERPSVNGLPLLGEAQPLRDGDLIELAGTQMRFSQR